MPLQIDQVEYTVTANGLEQVVFPNLTETMRAVVIYWTGQGLLAGVERLMAGRGFWDGTPNAGAFNSWQIARNGAVWTGVRENGQNPRSSQFGNCSLGNWNPGGNLFNMNWSDTNGVDIDVRVMAIAGNDVEAQVVQRVLNSTDIQEIAIPFQSKAVWTQTVGLASTNANNSRPIWCFGNYDGTAQGYSAGEFTNSIDGSNTPQAEVSNDYVCAQQLYGSSAVSWQARLTNNNESGFQFRMTGGGWGNDVVGILALGGNVEAAMFQGSTLPGQDMPNDLFHQAGDIVEPVLITGTQTVNQDLGLTRYTDDDSFGFFDNFFDASTSKGAGLGLCQRIQPPDTIVDRAGRRQATLNGAGRLWGQLQFDDAGDDVDYGLMIRGPEPHPKSAVDMTRNDAVRDTDRNGPMIQGMVLGTLNIPRLRPYAVTEVDQDGQSSLTVPVEQDALAQVGDLLIAVVQGNGTAGWPFTLPEGWSTFRTRSNGNIQTALCQYRVTQAGAVSHVFTAAQSTTNMQSTCLHYRAAEVKQGDDDVIMGAQRYQETNTAVWRTDERPQRFTPGGDLLAIMTYMGTSFQGNNTQVNTLDWEEHTSAPKTGNQPTRRIFSHRGIAGGRHQVCSNNLNALRPQFHNTFTVLPNTDKANGLTPDQLFCSGRSNINRNLLAAWPCTDTPDTDDLTPSMIDISGAGNDVGTFIQTGTQKGPLGGQLSGNDVSSKYAQAPFSLAGLDELTVTAWINNRGGSTGSQFGQVFGANTSSERFYINKTTWAPSVTNLTVAGTNVTGVNSYDYFFGFQWMFVAAVFRANTVQKMYINGFETASGSPAATGFVDPAMMTIMGQAGQPFNGWMKDIRVFDRQLTDADIRTIAGHMYIGFDPNVVVPPTYAYQDMALNYGRL